MIEVTVRHVTVPWLGQRWVARCERCHVDLPGRHCDRQGAESAGDLHIVDRHLGPMEPWEIEILAALA